MPDTRLGLLILFLLQSTPPPLEEQKGVLHQNAPFESKQKVQYLEDEWPLPVCIDVLMQKQCILCICKYIALIHFMASWAWKG